MDALALQLQAGQAEYWLAQGNPEQAKEYARRLLESASHYEAPKYIAVAHKLLAEVAEIADAEFYAGLREAVESHLLVVDHTGRSYAFRHALTRDAVYEDMLPGERTGVPRGGAGRAPCLLTRLPGAGHRGTRARRRPGRRHGLVGGRHRVAGGGRALPAGLHPAAPGRGGRGGG